MIINNLDVVEMAVEHTSLDMGKDKCIDHMDTLALDKKDMHKEGTYIFKQISPNIYLHNFN